MTIKNRVRRQREERGEEERMGRGQEEEGKRI